MKDMSKYVTYDPNQHRIDLRNVALQTRRMIDQIAAANAYKNGARDADVANFIGHQMRIVDPHWMRSFETSRNGLIDGGR